MSLNIILYNFLNLTLHDILSLELNNLLSLAMSLTSASNISINSLSLILKQLCKIDWLEIELGLIVYNKYRIQIF